MGFRITIEAEGGIAGCDGNLAADADAVWCGRAGCPECMLRGFAESLRQNGMKVVSLDIERSSASSKPKPPPVPKLLPTKAEFVAAGYDPAVYEKFLENRHAELAAMIAELKLSAPTESAATSSPPVDSPKPSAAPAETDHAAKPKKPKT